MQGQYEIISADDDAVRFRLRSATGSILAISRPFTDRDALVAGVREFQQICLSNVPFHREALEEGRWRFVVHTPQGDALAESPPFENQKLMEASVKLTQLNGPRAPLGTDRSRRRVTR